MKILFNKINFVSMFSKCIVPNYVHRYTIPYIVVFLPKQIRVGDFELKGPSLVNV